MNEFEMENEYVENIPTEEFNPADDYTIDSYAQQAPEQKKEYPVLQTITSLATGVESKGPVDSKQLINESYNAYAPKVQDEQKSLAMEAAKTGNTQQLDFLVQDMHQRNRELLAQEQNEVKRISELAGKAYENLVFKSYGVTVNNTPEQIANYIDKSSNSATVAAINEQWIKNDLTLGGYAKSVALSFTLFGVTPTYALGSVAEKYIDKDSSKVFYGDNVRGLKNYYDSLPNEDARVSFVTSIKKELEDTWSLTKADSAGIVQKIIGTEEITTFSNVAETASPVIGAIPLVGQLARAGKAVSAANKIAKAATNTEKILATSGNKSLLVSDAVNQIRLKAATDVVSEASGFTTVVDLSRLAGRATSWTGAKLLPDAVITASGNVQKEILSSVDKAVQQLKTTLRPANVRAAEVTELEDIVRKSYDRSIDPTIQNVVFGRLDDDLTGVVATILRGTKEGDVFLTKAAVDEYIRVADPNGKKGLKAVQDTANNTHALSEQTKKTLQLERDVAQVKLLELQTQQGKVVAKPAPKVKAAEIISAAKLPKELSGAKPNYAIGTNKFSLQFDNDIDKAAFITSQTKKSKRDADYVTWLKESTGWDDAKIAEHGQKVRDAIKASAKVSEPGTLKVEKTVSKVTQRQLTDLQQQEVFAKATGATVFELRGRMNKAAQSSAERGDFKGVLSALEKSKNLLVAEVARRAKGLDTKIVISDDAVETYSAPAAWLRQDAIDSAKSHLNVLEEIRRIAPLIEALPDKKFSYGVLSEVEPYYKWKSTLEEYARLGFTPTGKLPGGVANLETKADFKAFKENFETATREYGEDKLKITATASAEMVGISGRYDVETDTIYIPGWLRHNEEVLAHEIVHAQVLKSVANPTAAQKPAVQRLEDLYSHVKDKLSENKYKPYGIASVQEFIAEGLSNPMFQYQLNKISYKTASVWDSFVKVIANLIGIKSDSAFTELLSIYGELAPMKGEVNITGRALKGAPENEIPAKIMETETKVSIPGALKVQNQVEQVQTKREAGTRNFWETARPIDNTEEIKKLEATIELIEGRLKAAKDIENGLSAGWLVEEKVTKTLDISKLGKFEESDIQSMIRVSLGDRALGASEEVYKNHLIGVMAESRLRKTLVDMIDEPFQKLSRKEKALLNSVLIKGDKEGTIFDSVQLRGEGLTSDNAQKAYYATRAARDLMWSIRNKAAADSATMKGLKDIWHPSLNKYKDEWNEFKLFGKEVDGVGKTALDPETGKVVNLTKEKVEELTNRGFKVIEFDTPVPMAGVKRNRIVVQSGGLEMNKITQVIPYRNGEYSRMYTDEYFIRLTGKGKGVDDLEEDLVITHRTASNVNEANAYVKAYNEMVDLYKAGKLTTEAASKMQAYGWKAEDLIAQISESPNLRAVKNYTRTEDDYLDALTSYSRNFTSKRGEHIPNVFGETTNVIDPLDALAAEISNTAYVASHSEWLDVSIQRWFETAKPFLPSALKVDSATLETMSADQAFARYMRTKEGYVGGDRTELFIHRVAHQIAEAMKVNDKSSRQMLGVMRTITERIEETTGTMHTVGSFMRQAEWESWAKTFSFHAVFGFNPIQTVVQGLNTVNAIMISPVHGLKAARTAIFLRGAMTSDNPDVWKNIGKVNEWTKLGLGSDDDFIKLVTSLERTGLMQNLQTSSLYGLQAGKNDLTTGFFGKLASKVSKGSSFFFREGEGGARIVSFDIARREWMVKNPGKDWGTDEALREIIERQDVLTGTMTNANAASWQKGLISIPLQFMQFPIKFTLNIANSLAGGKRGFTRKEALTLLGGNVLLFGSAGLYGNSLVQAIFGKEIEEMPETVRIGLAEGAIAAAVSAVSAEFDESERLNLAIGTRLSPLNFYRDLATALTSWEDPGMFETFSGAFGGVVVRSSEALKQIWNLYTIDPDMSPERLSLAVKALATIPSVGRNYFSGQAAENLYNQVVKNGVSQYAVTDKEAFFLKYFGIRNIEATEYWKRTSNKADYQKKMKELAQQITNLRVKSLELYNAGSYADAQIHSDMASILQNSLPLGDRAEVEKMIKEPSPISNRLQDLTRESLFNFGSSQKEYIPIEKK